MRSIAYLSGVDVAPGAADVDALDTSIVRACDRLTRCVTLLAPVEDPPRVFVVTRGTQPVGAKDEEIAVGQAPLWGLTRAVALEHPALRSTLIDLNRGEGLEVDTDRPACEVVSDPTEQEVALRRGNRLARTIAPVSAAGPAVSLACPDAANVALVAGHGGSLDRMRLVPRSRAPLPPRGVGIAVCAAGVRFRDVMSAMGLSPGAPIALGSECAGRAVSVGSEVEGLDPRDEVIAIAPASFARFATTIPIALLTAYYALVHAAAGGVGLAAVQIAQHRGARDGGQRGEAGASRRVRRAPCLRLAVARLRRRRDGVHGWSRRRRGPKLPRAFRLLSQRKVIGKVVLRPHGAVSRAAPAIRGDGSYVVTGGLGALGLEVARWLAMPCAGAVVLVGRRPPSARTQAVARSAVRRRPSGTRPPSGRRRPRPGGRAAHRGPAHVAAAPWGHSCRWRAS